MKTGKQPKNIQKEDKNVKETKKEGKFQED